MNYTTLPPSRRRGIVYANSLNHRRQRINISPVFYPIRSPPPLSIIISPIRTLVPPRHNIYDDYIF